MILTHTCELSTMCGFSKVMAIGISSSEISGFSGVSVPLVRIMLRTFFPSRFCILQIWKKSINFIWNQNSSMTNMRLLSLPKASTETPIVKYFCVVIYFVHCHLRLNPAIGISLWTSRLLWLLRFHIHFIASSDTFTIINGRIGEYDCQ